MDYDPTEANSNSDNTGNSVYQFLLEAGGSLTVQQFLESLKGPKGDKGDPGIQGVPGPTGPQGVTISAEAQDSSGTAGTLAAPNLKSYGIVSVKDFGAKGDGVADDTSAIQSAVDSASESNCILLFPKPSVQYLISRTISLKPNTNIVGNNSKIFMASKTADNVTFMFNTSSSVYTDTITITGLTIASQNNRVGQAGSYYEGSKISNVKGFGFQGVTNVSIQDVVMTDLLAGIAFVSNAKATNLNKSINIKDVRIYNTSTPILIKSTREFFLSDSVLDAYGSANKHLHCIYIDTDCQNVYMNDVRMANSSGAGIQIYSEEAVPLQNAVFSNVTMDKCKVGMYIYSGASQISVNGITITNCETALDVNNCNGVTVTGGTVKGITKQTFYLENAQNLTISCLVIDAGSTNSSDVIRLLSIQKNVIFDNITFTNLPGSANFLAADDPGLALQGVTLQNCSFDFNNPAPDKVVPFYLAGAGAEMLIQNNRFSVKNGVNYYYLLYALQGTKVTVRNNTLNGFNQVSRLAFSIVYDNVLNGKPTRNTGSATLSDGGAIAHGLPAVPVSISVTGSVPAQIVSVISKNDSSFKVAIKTSAGAAGTPQLVYWSAEYNL